MTLNLEKGRNVVLGKQIWKANGAEEVSRDGNFRVLRDAGGVLGTEPRQISNLYID